MAQPAHRGGSLSPPGSRVSIWWWWWWGCHDDEDDEDDDDDVDDDDGGGDDDDGGDQYLDEYVMIMIQEMRARQL